MIGFGLDRKTLLGQIRAQTFKSIVVIGQNFIPQLVHSMC